MQFVFILVIIKILCIFTQDALAINLPSGAALILDGRTSVVLPAFSFGGPFTIETWVKADLNDHPGPLLFFGNTDDFSGATDHFEVGIAPGGDLYLEFGIVDEAAFRAKLPATQPELDDIRGYLTTNPDATPLVRRVTWKIPLAHSGQWFLIDIRASLDGVISCFINRELVGHTSALDIGILPAFTSRSYNRFGANLVRNFIGQLQRVTIWRHAVATRDILDGFTSKVYEGGLLGRWDFSYTVDSLVINQAAEDVDSVNKKTKTLQTSLDSLYNKLDELGRLKAAVVASGNTEQLPYLESQIVATKAAIDKAKTPAVITPGSVSYSNVIPSPASPMEELTTNTLSDLAYIATQNNKDDDLYLRLALDAKNKLPFRAKNVNSRSGFQTSYSVVPINVQRTSTAQERLDGTIVIAGGGDDDRKRFNFWDWLFGWGWDWWNWDWRICHQIPQKLDMQCAWNNDPHYAVQSVFNNSINYKFDYHSPNCHIILKAGDDVQILEESYRCGSAAGCISKVGAFVAGRYVVIFDKNGDITVNGEKIRMPYRVATGVMIERKGLTLAPTLTVDGMFELSFTGSAKLLFSSDQYNNADNRSVCVQKKTIPNKEFDSRWDLEPKDCFLNPAWEPPATQCPTCQNGGVSSFDLQQGCYCKCPSGWRGNECEKFYCDVCLNGVCTGPNQCTCDTTDPNNIFGCPDCHCHCSKKMCQNGGTPYFDANNECACNCPPKFAGALCERLRCPNGDNGLECAGQGTCLPNATCQCIPDVSFGETCSGNCSVMTCESTNEKVCSGHGQCACGHCICKPGFLGETCGTPVCTNLTGTPNAAGCGDHGTCDGSGEVPKCICKEGWSGPYCSDFTCANCSSHGVCRPADPPFCECKTGFIGDSCSVVSCGFLENCHTPKGTCKFTEGVDVQPKCECKEHWGGPFCQNPKCPNDCSQQGKCIDSPSDSDAAPSCVCFDPWRGNDCSDLPDCEIGPDDWSSPEWKARATSICTNTSYISADRAEMCLFDAQQIDNYEVLFAHAEASYSDCKLIEAATHTSVCTRMCPNFCNFNGLCDTTTDNTTAQCVCNPGFLGADCSIEPYKRTYVFKYDYDSNGQYVQEAELNQISMPAKPETFLKFESGSTHTKREVANGVVMFLYQDYRPKYGLCKPQNNLYLAVLMDQPRSSCVNRRFRFQLDTNGLNVSSVIPYNCLYDRAGDILSFLCAWDITQNAAVMVGPLPQNASWAIDASSYEDPGCYDTLYYGSEELTGKTDLYPTPLNVGWQVQITSELRNSECGVIQECSQCMATDGCGWCPDLGYCMDGTPSGPTVGTCSVWRYSADDGQSRVVRALGFGDPVFPTSTEVYLVEGSDLTIHLYTVFPAEMSLRVFFLMDLSKGMASTVSNFGTQAAQLLRDIQVDYPASTAEVVSFIDKNFAPYGLVSDYVYSEANFGLKTTDGTAFANMIRNLRLRDGGDEPNAQLEALIMTAIFQKDEQNPEGHRVAVVITGTPFHEPPNPFLEPNDLNGSPENGEDYPYVKDVRQKLLEANIVPVFVVVNLTVLPAYTSLVERLGFGYAIGADSTGTYISTAIREGIKQVFGSAKLVPANPKYVSDIFPKSYSSIQADNRVRFAITLDRAALKRAFVSFDTLITFTVPGFGSAFVQLTRSDAPVGTDHNETMVQNTEKTITLFGDNLYHTSLGYQVVTVPEKGVLLQNSITREVIKPGDFLTSPLHTLVYVPPVNGTCQYQDSDYCGSRKRGICDNPCPYAYFQYAVVDKCNAKSALVNVYVDVLPALQNWKPVAIAPNKVVTPMDTTATIPLSGVDKDGTRDTLTAVVTTLPRVGTLADRNGNISTVPHVVADNTVYFMPLYHIFGLGYGFFEFYINDGHEAWQMGNSNPVRVNIDVPGTNTPPSIANLRAPPRDMSATPEPICVSLEVTDVDAYAWTMKELSVYRRITAITRNDPEVGVLSSSDSLDILPEHRLVRNSVVPVVYGNGKADWRVCYHPEPFTFGNFTFEFQAFDTISMSKTNLVVFEIKHVNLAPTNLVPDLKYMSVDSGSTMVTLDAADIDGDAVKYVLVRVDCLACKSAGGTITDPVTGTVYPQSFQNEITLSSNQFLYTPGIELGTPTITFNYALVDSHGNRDYPHNVMITTNHVNVAPTIESRVTNYNLVQTTTRLTNITIADIDAVEDLTVTISLIGPGSIDLASKTSCEFLVKTPTKITFTCDLKLINSALYEGLTYTQAPGQTQAAQVTISADDHGVTMADNGNLRMTTVPQTGQLTLTLTPPQGAKTTTTAFTAGAVGAGAAAAVGLGATYKFLKVKKMFGVESDPFAGMPDVNSADVVLENPLYQKPARS